MPVDDMGQVHFTTTLFALIRESLSIKTGPASEMDIKDAELRDTVREMWPLQSKKMLNLLVPSDEGEMSILLKNASIWQLMANWGVGISIFCSKQINPMILNHSL